MHSSGYFQVKENEDMSPYGILIPQKQKGNQIHPPPKPDKLGPKVYRGEIRYKLS